MNAAERTEEGHVYYVAVGDLIKIGHSRDYMRRLRAYPPQSQLLALEPGGRTLERERLEEFTALRAHAHEWMRRDESLLAHIRSVVEAHGEPPAYDFLKPPLPRSGTQARRAAKGTPLRGVRIDDALWDAAKVQAARDGLTVSDIIRRSLANYAARDDTACVDTHAADSAKVG